MDKLIVVESPTKARTIKQYLGEGYRVLSSQGHVRDLPVNELGVDVENGFNPKLQTRQTKRLKELRQAAKQVNTVFLATDNDREGEAIAYDLYEILRRVVQGEGEFLRPIFNEITKSVIKEALANPSTINLNKVEAQRTRRILDRLVGYQVSPLLSKALAGSRFEGLSAGRVQSVALRFLCDREAEISRFTPEEYWEIEAQLSNSGPFIASLTKKDGKKFVIRGETEAEEISRHLRKKRIVVSSISDKKRIRQPAPPFITSSLQQTASSALGFAPKRTMRVAQELYEGVSLPEGNTGLITYMRTDSVRVSESAITEARETIVSRYGERYLVEKARRYRNKRNSQDAHEAIRPTSPSRTAESIARHLDSDQRKLYSLIWGRFVATQMGAAVYSQRKVVVDVSPYTLEVSGSTLEFDGFLKLLPQAKGKDVAIPSDLEEGQALTLDKVAMRQKFSEPPRRYSEAGLINLLEKKGIGRPSTYASIISIIQERRYATKEKGSLRPTLLGQVVVDFLKKHFSETVETEFTAHLEEDLDQIEEGRLTRQEALEEFYEPFSKRLDRLEGLLGDGEERPFRVETDLPCSKCGAPMELRYWKGSHFLGCSNYPACRNTVSVPPDLPYRYGKESLVIREALEEWAREAQTGIPCPKCGSPMELKVGRYGRYYRCTNEECKETASVSTGVPCPVCKDGVLVEKYSQKRRRTFYSCSNYPKCRFAVSERPIKVCPSCESGVLVHGADGLVCSNKKCGYREPAD